MNNKTKPVLRKIRKTKTKTKKQNQDYLTVDKICLSLCLLTAGICIFVAALVSLKYVYQNAEWNRSAQSEKNNSFQITKSELPKFNSCQALANKLKEGYKIQEKNGTYLEGWGISKMVPLAGGTRDGETADYSTTNIQVAGVDEADIVKTDGKYIYTVSKNNITISQAYPSEKAKLLSKIKISDSPREIFIDGNNLLIFGARNTTIPLRRLEKSSSKKITPEIYPDYSYRNLTFVEIYNLSNRRNPVLKRKLEFEGNYYSSRKIGNYVYFVLNNYPNYQALRSLEGEILPSKLGKKAKETLPVFWDSSSASSEFNPLCSCSEISYLDPVINSQYLTVIGLPIDDYNKEITKKVILGGGENVYASLENLYIAKTNYSYRQDFNWLDSVKSGENSSEKTTIYKFSLNKDKINYFGEGEVKGRVLNQFSMDEYDGNFRIATTIGRVSRHGGKTSNNIYVLDKNLKLVGSLENIAPGENIHSARFMGKKGYLVTFKKVDPFFTLDLSDPKSPKIIGKLKIPGYSDYLHPYDENHIIGIGKNTVEAEESWGGDFVWYQGIKIALFDISDFNNPKEMYKTVIGDRGSSSPVLKDHKAFLFDKDKNLLVIPILLAEIPEDQKKDPKRARNLRGDYTFQGSYVYDLSLDKGFVLKGRVSHYDDDEIFKKSGYYFGDNDLTIKRNLYIGDSLYSISDKKILINSLDNLSEKGKIDL